MTDAADEYAAKPWDRRRCDWACIGHFHRVHLADAFRAGQRDGANRAAEAVKALPDIAHHTFTDEDGYTSISMHTNAEAIERVLAAVAAAVPVPTEHTERPCHWLDPEGSHWCDELCWAWDGGPPTQRDNGGPHKHQCDCEAVPTNPEAQQ